MATCSCGNAALDPSGFAFVDHRLHGAEACARQHTFGEVIRAVVDGASDVAAILHTLAETTSSLVAEAVARLHDAGVLHVAHGGRLRLADGIATQDEAEAKLVASGTYRPGDLMA
jgi:hypothetical protein